MGYLGASLSGDLSLKEDVDIELTLTELLEEQRQEVSTTTNPDGRAPFAQVLNFWRKCSWHWRLGWAWKRRS